MPAASTNTLPTCTGNATPCHMFTPSAIPVAIIASTAAASAQCTAISERVNRRTQRICAFADMAPG